MEQQQTIRAATAVLVRFYNLFREKTILSGINVATLKMPKKSIFTACFCFLDAIF